ncbi:hypothetical protein D3C71_1823440 [compost metagenome]
MRRIAKTLHIVNDPKMDDSSGAARKPDTSHGGFDNDINVMTRVLSIILDLTPDVKLPRPVINLDY